MSKNLLPTLILAIICIVCTMPPMAHGEVFPRFETLLRAFSAVGDHTCSHVQILNDPSGMNPAIKLRESLRLKSEYIVVQRSTVENLDLLSLSFHTSRPLFNKDYPKSLVAFNLQTGKVEAAGLYKGTWPNISWSNEYGKDWHGDSTGRELQTLWDKHADTILKQAEKILALCKNNATYQ